jgi:hypothetical protein
MNSIKKYTPSVLISVIQFSMGLKMSLSGIKYISSSKDYVIIILSVVLFIIGLTKKLFPFALVLFIIGMIKVIVNTEIIFKISNPIEISLPNKNDFLQGFIKGTITQLPLTLLNSVLSLTELSNVLFPESIMTIKEISLSIFTINCFSVFLGAIPSCHGAGGLMSQYSYGARTGTSMVILGVFKILISVLLGNCLDQVLSKFPIPILGILLLSSGIELSIHGLKSLQTNENNLVIFLIGTSMTLQLNTFYGYVSGLFIHSYYTCIDNYPLLMGGMMAISSEECNSLE